MRLFPAANFLFAAMLLSTVSFPGVAFAQEYDNGGGMDSAELQNAMRSVGSQDDVMNIVNAMNSQNRSAQAQNGMLMGGGPALPGQQQAQEEELTEEELQELLRDRDSPQYKAQALADKARADGDIINFAEAKDAEKSQSVTDIPVPPEMDQLQDIHGSHGTDFGIADEEANEELVDLDIRKDAQKEAALSYGARGGLAKRSYQIAERLQGYEGVLDKVYNFRALLMQAPSGLLIEPPIVAESFDSMVITRNGNEAAVADRVLDINKSAKIVSAPRDWRQYLIVHYETEVATPPKILWPKDAKEQADWNKWVRQGWEAGFSQGDDAFESNLNRLAADFNGMVRYRMLLAEGMISQPYATHQDRGVTGSKTKMRVGDRALRITGPSQFLTGSELWKPADR